MPKTVNTGFVCFKKASTVRTLNTSSSQAQSFTNKQGYYQKKWNTTKSEDGDVHLYSYTFSVSAIHYFDTSDDRCAWETAD